MEQITLVINQKTKSCGNGEYRVVYIFNYIDTYGYSTTKNFESIKELREEMNITLNKLREEVK